MARSASLAQQTNMNFCPFAKKNSLQKNDPTPARAPKNYEKNRQKNRADANATRASLPTERAVPF
jgi:hypothetical protein